MQCSIRSSALRVRPDSYWGEAVLAIVALEPGRTLSAEDLIEHCKSLIASYKKPRSVVFVDEMPRLPSGKINKVLLRERYRNGAA